MNKHDTLLLACEKTENRQYMRGILGKRYHLLEADNAQQTISLLAQNRHCLAAVVLDVSPSDLLTIDLLSQAQWQREIGQMPVIVLATQDANDIIRRGFELGAADVMAFGEEPLALLHRIETVVQLYLHRQHLAQRIQEQTLRAGDSRQEIRACAEDRFEKLSVEGEAELEQMKNRLRRYEIILAQTENVLFDWDVKEDRLELSETWRRVFRSDAGCRSVREILDSDAVFHPDDRPLLMKKLSRLEAASDYEVIDARVALAGGEYIWCRFRCTGIRDTAGELERVCGVMLNIDAEKRAEETLQSQAQRDGLTRLLNKKAARERAEEYLSRCSDATPCALLMIDLDHFKQVNDRLGHLFGDAVLSQTAGVLAKMFRDQDIVARIGGDEFMVLMRDVHGRDAVKSRCRRMIDELGSLFRSAARGVPLGCSIGIALSPEHGTTYYDLYNKADQALYHIKKNGKNGFAFYGDVLMRRACDATGAADDHRANDRQDGKSDAQKNLMYAALDRLYGGEETETRIRELLAMVGRRANVSRVYVFENTDDNRCCANTYEWCNEGIESAQDRRQRISYETDVPGYAENFDERGIFYCADMTALPPQIESSLKHQNIQSMLQCAIRENGVFRGYIGFDECARKRLWTKEEIRMLSDLTQMLSAFLLKHRDRERMNTSGRRQGGMADQRTAAG